MSRRIYPRPPIVEAVIDIHFVEQVPERELLDALVSRLGHLYSGPQRPLDRIEFSVSLRDDGAPPSRRRLHHFTLMQSADGLRLLGCGEGAMSVHVLAPYPGWESFLDQAKEAVDALPEAARSATIKTMAVRYIDRITLPSADVAFNEYLAVMPPRPLGMPQQLSGFHVLTQSIDPSDNTLATLLVASAPPDDQGLPAIVYDFNVQRNGTPLCPVTGDDWVCLVEALHERQRDIFEASITERTRELFQ